MAGLKKMNRIGFFVAGGIASTHDDGDQLIVVGRQAGERSEGGPPEAALEHEREGAVGQTGVSAGNRNHPDVVGRTHREVGSVDTCGARRPDLALRTGDGTDYGLGLVRCRGGGDDWW